MDLFRFFVVACYQFMLCSNTPYTSQRKELCSSVVDENNIIQHLRGKHNFSFAHFDMFALKKGEKGVIFLVNIPIKVEFQRKMHFRFVFCVLFRFFSRYTHLEHSEEKVLNNMNSELHSSGNILETKSTVSDNITFC